MLNVRYCGRCSLKKKKNDKTVLSTRRFSHLTTNNSNLNRCTSNVRTLQEIVSLTLVRYNRSFFFFLTKFY